LDAYEKAKLLTRQALHLLGCISEGPYFSINQRGAQDPKYIRDPIRPNTKKSCELSFYQTMERRTGTKRCDRIWQICQIKKRIGWLAHTDAVYEEVLEAFQNGYSLATHFYSAMSGVTREMHFVLQA
jgi:N-acetylglucosamine-6-phosphate deacetylase